MTATASRSAASGRSSSMPSLSSHAPFARPRNARPPETASSIATWPAISYGCSVNGLSAAGPSRMRSVTRAMSSSGPIAGWSSRSWYTESTSMPPVLGAARERLVLLRRLVRPNADAELAGYVSSSVTSVRSPIRSMRMTRRSSGSGHATSESCSSQSSSGSLPHLRGQQRQHRLDGEEAEVLARPGCARGSTRSPRRSRRPRARRRSGPRCARRSRAGRRAASRSSDGDLPPLARVTRSWLTLAVGRPADAGSPRQSVARARARVHGAVHGDPRRDDRERRTAVHPDGPRHVRRRPPVDRERVHAHVRRLPAAGRTRRRPRGTQEGVPRRSRRLHGRVAAQRARAELRRCSSSSAGSRVSGPR